MGRSGALPLLGDEGNAALLGSKGMGLLSLPAFQEVAGRARDLGELTVSKRLDLPGEQVPSIALVFPVFRGLAVAVGPRPGPDGMS